MTAFANANVRHLTGHAVATADRRARSMVNWALRDGPGLLSRSSGTMSGDPITLLLFDESQRTKARALEFQDAIRSRGPLVRAAGGRIYASAHYSVAKEVLSGEDFRSVNIDLMFSPPLRNVYRWSMRRGYTNIVEPPSLLVMEPPEHTRYRRLVSRAFTVRAVAQMRTKVTDTVHELLSRLDVKNSNAPVDLMEHYCGLLPVTVIAEIFGVPRNERERLRVLGDALAPSLDIGLSWQAHQRVEKAAREFDSWLGGHIQRLRANPGDDLLSQLATISDGTDVLTETELKATAGILLGAGFETTVNLLGNGIKLLSDNTGQLYQLSEDPGLWPNAIEEILRYDPPVALTARISLRDTEVAGVRIPARKLVMLVGANHDADKFANPHAFDVARPNAKEHLAFGGGRHFCIGAALARMEGEVGLRAFFEAFPNMSLAPNLQWAPGRALRGWKHLPATLRPSNQRQAG
ncbi:cytochrome P450 [Mycobacteroides abscessus]|uniref:cytochrome P450 n=1 Tax=Mycobacteroides abscessus TaxID=36809 RepID=UPI002105B3C7|nr:cytochrome P450 [Mycobacteroides abscessus]